MISRLCLRRPCASLTSTNTQVVRHKDFASFGAYLADATKALQRRFDSQALDFEGYCTWQNVLRFFSGKQILNPRREAAQAQGTEERRGGGGGRRGRPPLPPQSVVNGLKHRTLDDSLHVDRGVEAGWRQRRQKGQPPSRTVPSQDVVDLADEGNDDQEDDDGSYSGGGGGGGHGDVGNKGNDAEVRVEGETADVSWSSTRSDGDRSGGELSSCGYMQQQESSLFPDSFALATSSAADCSGDDDCSVLEVRKDTAAAAGRSGDGSYSATGGTSGRQRHGGSSAQHPPSSSSEKFSPVLNPYAAIGKRQPRVGVPRGDREEAPASPVRVPGQEGAEAAISAAEHRRADNTGLSTGRSRHYRHRDVDVTAGGEHGSKGKKCRPSDWLSHGTACEGYGGEGTLGGYSSASGANVGGDANGWDEYSRPLTSKKLRALAFEDTQDVEDFSLPACSREGHDGGGSTGAEEDNEAIDIDDVQTDAEHVGLCQERTSSGSTTSNTHGSTSSGAAAGASARAALAWLPQSAAARPRQSGARVAAKSVDVSGKGDITGVCVARRDRSGRSRGIAKGESGVGTHHGSPAAASTDCANAFGRVSPTGSSGAGMNIIGVSANDVVDLT